MARNAERERADAKLVNWSEAPGYRDATFTVEINGREVDLQFSKWDAIAIASRILQINDLAWDGHEPIDVERGEKRPAWVVPFGTRLPLCPLSKITVME